MNIKDTIYPTIKKKFDELNLMYDWQDDRFYFFDDEGNNHLIYNRLSHVIAVDMDYFMLRYFGINSYSYNEDVSGIFMELLKDFLGDEYRDSKISHNDVYYTTNKNL